MKFLLGQAVMDEKMTKPPGKSSTQLKTEVLSGPPLTGDVNSKPTAVTANTAATEVSNVKLYR
jgi:hypothetical protein